MKQEPKDEIHSLMCPCVRVGFQDDNVILLNLNKYSLLNSQLRTPYGNYQVMVIAKEQVSIKGRYKIMSTFVYLIGELLKLQLANLLKLQFQACCLLARLTFHP
jgi:hypothetical protein